jgi:MFS family permease
LISFFALLRGNRNYRYCWIGQVVSEIGDHFNNIAIFSLAMEKTGSGLVVSGVMLSRALPAVAAGPIAGVLLDRLDRRQVMIGSDLVRFVFAACFLFTVADPKPWLLYLFSALLMFASPFFTSGRSSILPAIASRDELHTANALTQTTQWTTLTLGAFLAGVVVTRFGYVFALLFNSVSFLFSAWAISKLRLPGGFRPHRVPSAGRAKVQPWREWLEGWNYMRSNPLVLGIALVGVGWATGGGAAQILFALFGEQVFNRGAEGIGTIWGAAGLGLLIGGMLSHRLGSRLTFAGYKRSIALCYIVHGVAYVVFSQMRHFGLALVFIALSRAAVAISSVLNFSQLLRRVPDHFRGRTFALNESMTWMTMMVSMAVAGIASVRVSPRTIGAVAGILSSTTAFFWVWADLTGRLPRSPDDGKPAAARHDPAGQGIPGTPKTSGTAGRRPETFEASDLPREGS